MEDWYNSDKIWKTISKKDRTRMEKFRPMVARLVRAGYSVLQFDPGVVIIPTDKLVDGYDTNYCARLDSGGWEILDKALAEIERLQA